MKIYPKNGNPICPYSREDCVHQDMDGYTDCTHCQHYCNGVKATGGMPIVMTIYKKICSFFK